MSTNSNEKDTGSIYEKFKENTQKIFNEDSFKEGLDKGYQMLNKRQISKKSKRSFDNKVNNNDFNILFIHTSAFFKQILGRN